MKVICLANKLSKDQKKQLGIVEENDFKYPFEEGQIYTVLGMTNNLIENGSITLEMPYFYIFPTPLCLFNVIDDRPSKYWKIKKISEHQIAFRPEEFYQKYFHDRLSDGDPEFIDIYQKVLEKLEKEFD
ncbi:hypothetical protein [unidentified bacterial endosymbiont]|uniref:hypothetical protein n=1 Tax=unidentified bacterial endosymbiont TaxID=2355 RepID=UPI0020A05828|nr:hypothetical protein [unidentified bacterial endosymbiont]